MSAVVYVAIFYSESLRKDACTCLMDLLVHVLSFVGRFHVGEKRLHSASGAGRKQTRVPGVVQGHLELVRRAGTALNSRIRGTTQRARPHDKRASAWSGQGSRFNPNCATICNIFILNFSIYYTL